MIGPSTMFDPIVEADPVDPEPVFVIDCDAVMWTDHPIQALGDDGPLGRIRQCEMVEYGPKQCRVIVKCNVVTVPTNRIWGSDALVQQGIIPDREKGDKELSIESCGIFLKQIF